MSAPRSIRLDDLLLPREHGSWSIALEPVALGLLAAPSGAGVALAVAVLALFLVRRPLRLWWDDRNPASHRRTSFRVSLALTGLATITGLIAGWLGGGAALWPLLLPVPVAALFVYFDLQGETRAAAAELAGTTAFALLPLAFGTLAGLPFVCAAGLAGAMAVRLVPTVIVVRAYLRTRKEQPASRGLALGASAAGVAVAATLAAHRMAPHMTLALALVLLARAAWLLGPWAPRLRARSLGLLESLLGAGFVLTIAFS